MVVDLLTKITPIFWLFNENSYWFLIKFKIHSNGRVKLCVRGFLEVLNKNPCSIKKITWQMIQNLLSVSLNCSKCLLILLQVLTNPLNVFDLCPCWSTLTGFLFRIQVSPLITKNVHISGSFDFKLYGFKVSVKFLPMLQPDTFHSPLRDSNSAASLPTQVESGILKINSIFNQR